ncbi:conserved hypothetical protein [uncultured Mycobacterium sp.]|uniref:Uncharacterized protein n=1 Tax=uncultured Mycobacterium sp. TaxID=171292 RepID=A0A1Y5PSG5_9MYCO|nr:conserved hypothetical protein [uncultured Mycobacterium sp.]
MFVMSTWFSRVVHRLSALLDANYGPWNATTSGWSGGDETDADVRRLRGDLDALRVRFSDHR